MISPRTIILREILVGTDFSQQSNRAFDAALALAQHFGARLHVFHVVLDASEQKMALAKLKALTAETLEGTEIVRAVSVGQAAQEIVRYAGRERIDLIVMGTHGRTGLAHVLVGSVTEAVVRTAPCQVLTVGPKVGAAEEVAPSAQAAPPQQHCLVCARPAQETICDHCKARIQGEALERKRKEERPGRKGLSV
jgi:nucleotide-binding universal stress UspA family protein